MIKLFSKKEINTNTSKNINKTFPWLSSMDDVYSNLCNQDINIRIEEILALNTYFQSENGIKKLETLQNELISKGFPKDAANIEINFFFRIISGKHFI